MLQEQVLQSLIELQKKDIEIFELQKKLQEIPQEINVLKIEINKKKELLQSDKEEHKKLAIEHKELENNLTTCEELIAKHQVELNQVKSNEAFRALQKEIDGAKKQKDEIETRILNQMDKIQDNKTKQKELENEFKLQEEKIQNQINEIKKEEEQISKQLQSLTSEREKFVSQINPDVLKKYEYIRKQKQSVAVVKIKKHSDGKKACAGCNMLLNAQVEMELAKKDKLTQCDNCQRILYEEK